MVTQEVFEGQIAYLAKAGYKTLLLNELFTFIKGDLYMAKAGGLLILKEGEKYENRNPCK